MHDRKLDSVARQLATGVSRRAVLKGLLGVGVVATSASAATGNVEAARRGYAGPGRTGSKPPGGPSQCLWPGEACSYDRPGDCCSKVCFSAGPDANYPTCAPMDT